MLNWKGSSEYEEIQFQAISGFLSHRPQLIGFLFNPCYPKLIFSPEKIVENSIGFCCSDQILVRLALHLWCNYGFISAYELFKLDSEVFDRALEAIKILGPKPSTRYHELMQMLSEN